MGSERKDTGAFPMQRLRPPTPKPGKTEMSLRLMGAGAVRGNNSLCDGEGGRLLLRSTLLSMQVASTYRQACRYATCHFWNMRP